MASSGSEIQQTPLHSRHLAAGASMAPFGGWDMPLWYRAGAVREHLAVVQAAGLFDTSHMELVSVSGEAAREFLNFAFTRDIAGLQPGRCAYGAFLTREGHTVDDAIIYPFADGRHVAAVNASMGAAVREHLLTLPGASEVTVEEITPRLAKLDIQGPASPAILRDLLEDAAVLDKFFYFTFKGDFDTGRSDIRLRDGTPILLSRTGYTGELGFEIFLPADCAGAVWDAFLETGPDRGLLPCGLAARDSLRTGAVLPLSHQDIGGWPFINHPWPFALPLAEDGYFTKEFMGAGALDTAAAPYTLPFAGFDPRRVDAGTARVIADGEDIGRILTIVSDMAIGRSNGRIVSIASPDKPEGWTPRGLACGFVYVTKKLEPGQQVTLQDGRRSLAAEIVRDIRPGRSARKKLN